MSEHKIPFVHFGQKAPCKDCNRREQGCHSTCEDYKKWRSHRDDCIESERKRKRGEPIPHFVDKYFKSS